MEEYDYKYDYYGWGYPFDDGSDIIPADDPGGGGGSGGDGPTFDDMNAAIQAALDSINLEHTDDDTITLKVGDRDGGTINDIYVTDVEQIEENGEHYVNFSRSNGKEPLKVNIDVVEDPVIDGEFF